MAGRLDEEIAAAEREARAGVADPLGLLRLAQLYLRAGRRADARRILGEARGVVRPIVEGQDGAVEVATAWEEVNALLVAIEAEDAADARGAQREALVLRLGSSGLSQADHEELIRLELQDGVPLHPEPAACPACKGPLATDPRSGAVRCARSGRDGDLCRHTDATDLHRCGSCGLVVRAWAPALGKLRPQPNEPPAGVLQRTRCPNCNGPVASWEQHVFRCRKADAASFPRCATCGRRGHHARPVDCPRCKARITVVSCLEGLKTTSG
jgi:hypothetical protein